MKDQPEDKFNLVYLIFGWLGIGTLLPWNFFITVTAYWDAKWQDPNQVSGGAGNVIERNELQTNWGSNMAMASMIPNVTFLLLNAVFGHHFRTTPRLLVSLIFVILLFGATCAMTKIDTDEYQYEFYIGTLVSCVLININSAIFQGGLLGLAGKFPAEYMGIVFSGQAIGGIFASVTNVIVILLGVPPADAAFWCFLTAVIFLAIALVVFVIATRSEFFQHFLDENKVVEAGDEELSGKFLQSDVTYKPKKPNPCQVLGRISVYAASVYLIFTVTLACFPAITAMVISHTITEEEGDNDWGTKFFIPVCCFVLFNVGDWLGRFLGERLGWPKPGRFGMWFTFVLSLLRIGFVPLFIFCNVNPTQRNMTHVVFDSDYYYIGFMALFSLSNGYLSQICMMSAPQLVKGAEAQTAGSLMVALLGLGLGSGALVSYPVKFLL